MSIFRRRRSQDASAAGTAEDAGAQAAGAQAPGATEETAGGERPDGERPDGEQRAEAPGADRSAGPFDAAEVSEPDGRLALGALRLRGREGMELRFDVEEGTQRAIAVTVAQAGSSMQLQVFAAPRTLGVWEDIRAEIARSVVEQGGSVDEADGPFGRELLARLPVRTQDGRTGHQPTRFIGVDGPRWFLRAVVAGRAAHDREAARPLEETLRDVVVVRGAEAMAPRELLALTLPKLAPAAGPGGGGTAAGAQGGEAVASAGAPGTASEDPAQQEPAQQEPAQQEDPQQEDPQGGREPLRPFERGPEITEIR